MLADLSAVRAEVVAELLPYIVEAMKKKDYKNHLAFIQAVCKCIQPFAKGLGKKVWKDQMEMFFDDIFYAIVRFGTLGTMEINVVDSLSPSLL